MSNRTLLAACGLYCGACYHYRAAFPEGMHLLLDRARGGRPLEGYTCGGCWSDRHYDHSDCQACEIRACAAAHALQHCGECRDHPCDRLRAFQHNGRKHHAPVVEQLRAAAAIGAARWLAVQEVRWTCRQCGRPFSWYELTCSGCGAPLDSYGVDEPCDSS